MSLAPTPHSTTAPLLSSTLRATNSYPAATQPRLIHETLTTTRQYPTLHPILADYTTRQQAKPQRLLALRGTIPISYKAAQYHIPIHIWLMPYFPSGPPIAHVVPTPSMALRKRHPHVDVRDGMVYLPYLSQWTSSSSLPAFIEAMSHAFSQKPPVYTRVACVDAIRMQLIAGVSSRVHLALVDATEGAVRAAVVCEASRHLLEERRLSVGVVEARVAEVQRLEARARWLRGRLAVMRQWVMLHPVGVGDVDADTRPRHALREQEVRCKAMDWAIADAMDVLDECVVRKVMRAGEFVEKLRPLASEQFFARVMARKARARLVELKQRTRRRQGGEKGVGGGS